MAMQPWRPMQEMRRLADEMERLMEEAFGPLPTLTRGPMGPMMMRSFPVNVYQKNSDVIVEAELPGVRREDLDVSVSGRTLTIRAERKETREVKEEDYYRREVGVGRFWREITLPVEVRADQAEATFENGLLRLRLPQVQAVKKVPIQVKGGGGQ